MSVGTGYTTDPSRYVFGIGLNWSRPNKATFGASLGDQFTSEMFLQLQLTETLAVTPSLQIISNPALNPDDDTIALFGLRVRAAF